MSRLPPPPPPRPPPPLHEPPNDDPHQNENENENENESGIDNNSNSNSINNSSTTCTNTSYTNASTNTNTNTNRNTMPTSTISIRSAVDPGDIIQLLITPQMTQDEFAHCISHAALSPPHSQQLLQSWSSQSQSQKLQLPLPLPPYPLSFLRRDHRGGRRQRQQRQRRQNSLSRRNNRSNDSYGDYDKDNDIDSDSYHEDHDDEDDDDDDDDDDIGDHSVVYGDGTIVSADWTRIAGLFRESDDAFVPTKILLHNPQQYQDELFRISRSTLVSPPKRKKKVKLINTDDYSPLLFSWKRVSLVLLSLFGLKYFVHLFLLGTISAILYQMAIHNYLYLDASLAKLSRHSEYMVETIKKMPAQLDEYYINVPLQNLYRYGPNIIGWEGESLPRICQQITLMADENFWLRNIEECTKIYKNKENAMLHVRKPFVYIILVYAFFIMIQSLIRTWAAVHEKNNRALYHRDMVETYEAFDLIMKVISRGIMKYAPSPASPRPLTRR